MSEINVYIERYNENVAERLENLKALVNLVEDEESKKIYIEK